MNPNPNQNGPQINWAKTLDVKCECGHSYFTEVYMLKKILKTTIEIPGEPVIPEDRTVPIAVLKCEKCGAILEELLPPVLRPKKD